MGLWKNFRDDEVKGLAYGLVARLDTARDLCGFHIVITSGLRTPGQNAAAGGVPDSSHLRGIAVDIKMPVGKDEREKLIWALGRAGFRRVGLYDKHAHVDIAEDKPQDVVWFGVSHA